MEENNNPTNSSEYIDLIELWKKIWNRKKLFFIVWGITFVASCIIILPVPRSYESTIRLAPESTSSSAGGIGALSSLVGNIGINLGGTSSEDALFPDIYPDIISTNEFVVGLFSVPVHSIDGEIETTYGDYMFRWQHIAYYKWPKILLSRSMRWLIPPKKYGNGSSEINPQFLSREMDALVKKINDKITCDIDKKTGVISITVMDQDPLIAAEMADTIGVRLQKVITDYRTKKARNDEQYYSQLLNEAMQAYLKAQEEYVQFCEINYNVSKPSVLAQKDNLSNICDLRLETLNGVITQHHAACAKIQEHTPAFTTLEHPCVPIKASHPKRVIFVLFMLILSTLGTIGYLFKNEITEQLQHMK